MTFRAIMAFWPLRLGLWFRVEVVFLTLMAIMTFWPLRKVYPSGGKSMTRRRFWTVFGM